MLRRWLSIGIILALSCVVLAADPLVPAVPGFETVAHWAFNEGSGVSVPDSVDGIAGELVGAEWVEGVSGSGLHFQDSTYVRGADTSVLGPESFTVAFWLKSSTPAQLMSLWHTVVRRGVVGSCISCEHPYAGDLSYAVQIQANSNRLRAFFGNEDLRCYVYTQNAMPSNQWMHVAFTRGPGSARLYVNGQLAGQTIHEIGPVPVSSDLILGDWHDGFAPSAFTGDIDEVTVINGQVPDDGIVTLYEWAEDHPFVEPEPVVSIVPSYVVGSLEAPIESEAAVMTLSIPRTGIFQGACGVFGTMDVNGLADPNLDPNVVPMELSKLKAHLIIHIAEGTSQTFPLQSDVKVPEVSVSTSLIGKTSSGLIAYRLECSWTPLRMPAGEYPVAIVFESNGPCGWVGTSLCCSGELIREPTVSSCLIADLEDPNDPNHVPGCASCVRVELLGFLEGEEILLRDTLGEAQDDMDPDTMPDYCQLYGTREGAPDYVGGSWITSTGFVLTGLELDITEPTEIGRFSTFALYVLGEGGWHLAVHRSEDGLTAEESFYADSTLGNYLNLSITEVSNETVPPDCPEKGGNKEFSYVILRTAAVLEPGHYVICLYCDNYAQLLFSQNDLGSSLYDGSFYGQGDWAYYFAKLSMSVPSTTVAVDIWGTLVPDPNTTDLEISDSWGGCGCSVDNDWCFGGDKTRDGCVDANDFGYVAIPVAFWPFDEGGGDSTGELIGGSSATIDGHSWIEGVIGTALQFNGSNGKVDCGDDPKLGAEDLSVSFWTKPGMKPGDQILFERTGPGNVGNSYTIERLSTGQVLFSFDDGVTKAFSLQSTGILPYNVWRQVTVTRQNGVASIYINGVLDSSAEYEFTPYMGPAFLEIGGGSTTHSFYGGIDEVLITEGAMSAEDVLALYESAAP